MPTGKYITVRMRRADVDRIKATLHDMGDVYFTDWGHWVSWLTALELYDLVGTAGRRKQTEYMRRVDAGEVGIRPEELRDDADEDRINKQNRADDADDGSD